jgi:hypothetical protein
MSSGADMRRLRRNYDYDESGMSGMTEMTVGIFMFAIILLITTLVLSTLSNTQDTTARLSNSTENVQLGLAQVEQYIGGVVSPNTAASSSTLAGSSKAYTLGTSYPCWGSSQPNSNASGGQLPVAETSAILIAHDYDFEFCGYVTGTTAPHVPHVIRIFMTTPCSTTLHTCTLEVADYTKLATGFTSCTASSSSCTFYNTYTASGIAGVPKVLLTIPNVACDTYCYNASSLDGTTNGPSTANATTTNDAIACVDQASTTCGSSATPPLFSYYGTSGPTASGAGSPSGALNPSGFPLMDVASNNSGAGCSPTPAAGKTSDCETLQALQSVLLDLSIVGNNSPGHSTTKSSPSTNVADLIYIQSLQTTVTVPYAPTSVTVTLGSSGSGSITVQWKVPYDGGLTIGCFPITATPANSVFGQVTSFPATTAASPPNSCGGGTLSSTTGSTDTSTLTGLTSGQGYTVNVYATNQTTLNGNTVGGTSPASLPVVVTAP